MTTLNWATRCLPGLSLLAIFVLCEFALEILRTAYIGLDYPTGLVKGHTPVLAQGLFIVYSVALHLLAFFFPIRLCRAVWQATTAISNAHGIHNVLGNQDTFAKTTKIKDEEGSPRMSAHNGSEGQHGFDGVDIVHAIMIPSYKEDIGVLEDTLKVLASHGPARKSYDIFLAMEARDPNAVQVATRLEASFGRMFKHMQHTIHPSDIPGEAPGKSSNISWAAQKVQEKYRDSPNWKDVMLTVMDSDTHLLSNYFRLVNDRHLHNRHHGDMMDMTMYIPPIIFDRNAHHVPLMIRVADLMWCGAGLSCFQAKPNINGVTFPTSTYTVTLPLVHLVGGWDTDAGAIGEDMHMMLKCYFATNGRLPVESIPSPASHCNISSSNAGIRGWFGSHRARYGQALRHMWGCLDAGYAVGRWMELGKKSPIQTPPLAQSLSRHSELELRLSSYKLHGDDSTKLNWRNLRLLTRMFEAHFLPVHLLVVTIASTVYGNLAAPLVHCRFLTLFLQITAVLRACGFVMMLFYFFVFYEAYHRVCVRARESEMRRAGLFDEMEGSFTWRSKYDPRTWLDYVVFPVAGIAYGGVPLLHAAFAHFWTDRLDYKVSAKPKRLLAKLSIPVAQDANEEA